MNHSILKLKCIRLFLSTRVVKPRKEILAEEISVRVGLSIRERFMMADESGAKNTKFIDNF